MVDPASHRGLTGCVRCLPAGAAVPVLALGVVHLGRVLLLGVSTLLFGSSEIVQSLEGVVLFATSGRLNLRLLAAALVSHGIHHTFVYREQKLLYRSDI